MGQRLGMEFCGCHLTQAFEVGTLEPGQEALGQGGNRNGGGAEVRSRPSRGDLDTAPAHPPPLPVLFLLSFFAF